MTFTWKVDFQQSHQKVIFIIYLIKTQNDFQFISHKLSHQFIYFFDKISNVAHTIKFLV